MNVAARSDPESFHKVVPAYFVEMVPATSTGNDRVVEFNHLFYGSYFLFAISSYEKQKIQMIVHLNVKNSLTLNRV